MGQSKYSQNGVVRKAEIPERDGVMWRATPLRCYFCAPQLVSPFSLASFRSSVSSGCQISLRVLLSAHTIVYLTQDHTLIIRIIREKYGPGER